MVLPFFHKYKETFLLILILLVGFVFRIYYLNFGLPHNFHADEPEIVEPAIKYTFELRSIIQNNDYYKLIPVSFVYGTFPAYALTALIMLYSKVINLLNLGVDKGDLYVLSRLVSALLSLSVVFVAYLTHRKLFGVKGALLTALFLAVNWQQIVLAHYVNQDVYIVALQSVITLIGLVLISKNYQTWQVILYSVLVGFMVGTKITSVILTPVLLLPFISKKDWRSLVAFLFIVFGVFCATNPFSLIFFQDFMLRIWEMFFKEAGVVIDSYDTGVFKYLFALNSVMTLPVFVTAMLGLLSFWRSKSLSLVTKIYLSALVMSYLVFFSLSSRRVDRWVSPVVPVLTIFASYFISSYSYRMKDFGLKAEVSSSSRESFLLIHGLKSVVFPLRIKYAMIGVTIAFQIYYLGLLGLQYKTTTPKGGAYLWLRDNAPQLSTKFVLTDEGLDPINKLSNSSSLQFNQYESEGAFLTFPPSLDKFDYVILSSKSLDSYKREFVKRDYPYYFQKWETFEKEITNPNKYELVFQSSLPKPNLINVSDTFVYKKTSLTR